MGTNFYFRFKLPDGFASVQAVELPGGGTARARRQWSWDGDSPDRHIGKRSAAGPFCWDCRVTLTEGGNDFIHKSHSRVLEACPRCGKKPAPKTGFNQAAAVELGFADAADRPPIGVGSTSSFSWAMDPAEAHRICAAALDVTIVEDEYGDRLTGRQFLRMLECQCGVEFTHSVGRHFS